jgi:hypothetical protein
MFIVIIHSACIFVNEFYLFLLHGRFFSCNLICCFLLFLHVCEFVDAAYGFYVLRNVIAIKCD